MPNHYPSYYRRNSDEDLRNLERQYQADPDDFDTLRALLRTRRRRGLLSPLHKSWESMFRGWIGLIGE
jgi:hypothetical protein